MIFLSCDVSLSLGYKAVLFFVGFGFTYFFRRAPLYDVFNTYSSLYLQLFREAPKVTYGPVQVDRKLSSQFVFNNNEINATTAG